MAASAAAPGALASLETQLAQSPALAADELAIQAAADDVRAERDKTGLTYTYSNQIGPEAVIVPYNVDEHVLRFEQAIGVRVPISGSATTQLLTIADAERREQIAEIAMNAAYRERLAQLRAAYVAYWTQTKEVSAASTYLTSANDERAQALALLREGFWTQTEFMDYSSTVGEVSARENEARNEESAQLALISGAVGRSVAFFDPAPPEFFGSCSPDRAAALRSAYAVDTAIAQIEAETQVVQLKLRKVKGSGIEAALAAHAGSQTDINHQVSGYDFVAGIELSLPKHLRDEERADRAKYQTELQQLALEMEQRKAELTAQVDAGMAQIQGDASAEANARAIEAQRRRDYQTAVARFNTLKQQPAQAFSDVHAKLDALYVSTRALDAAESDRFLKANDLLKIAPGACGGTYEPIPEFRLTLPGRAQRLETP